MGDGEAAFVAARHVEAQATLITICLPSGPWQIPVARSRSPRIGSIPRDARSYCGVSAKYLGKSMAEAGKNVLTIKRIQLVQLHDGSVQPMDASRSSLWIDHPDEACSGAKPVGNLLQQLARSVVGRQNFDRKVGRESGITARQRIGNPFVSYERDVRRSNGIGIGRQHESCFRGEEST